MVSMRGRLVAGVHCSHRAARIVVCDGDTGDVLRQTVVRFADGAHGDPVSWLRAFGEAAGGGTLDGVEAIGVTAQGHGLIALDANGVVVAPPLAHDDISASGAAAELVDELGGPHEWLAATGSVPTAATAVSHLRRLTRFEPDEAERVVAAALPHDWLTWQLLGCPAELTTDRSDASTTGYWSPTTGAWREDLAEQAFGRAVRLPRLVAPGEAAGRSPENLLIAAGAGAEAALAFGLGVGHGDVVVAVGASGAAFAVHDGMTSDPAVACLADATGRAMPVVRTLNAVRVLRGTAAMLGVDTAGFDELAMRSTPGACGLVMLPYLDGERVPHLPHAAGTLTGLHRESMTPEAFARASVEGMACGLADALDVLRGSGVAVERVFLVGVGARSAAVRAVAPMLFGVPVAVPDPAEAARAAALGVARQAAWALSGKPDVPAWPRPTAPFVEAADEDAAVGTAVREQYAEVRDRLHPEAAPRPDSGGTTGRHRRG
ncbi:FGGY family carbohydrate kinase [Yinghuangia seranimata]|uniref:FGGY family carbohydrate kinase n=1 Tax=Yinghuangia seranimata TaxID=408067 RepID=UPI00248C6409|nr:FGGY family carbohydrate kinase [Yinghuangia seranimata]MDI2129250.1 FGGY family carbohydrate kinase [Yinghuangia seranimata]